MDKILTVEDVADILKVKPLTVREMFRTKRLRAFKIGKSWRTTEAMLQEDLQGMSDDQSGEAVSSADDAAVVSAPPAELEAEAATRPRKKREAKPKPEPKPEESEAVVEDNQQFLF